jgi:hypothetical protein
VPRRPRVLAVRTTSSGDWSTYVLRLVGPGGIGGPGGFDEPLASAPFRFTVDCPSDLDCRDVLDCPPVPPESPAVDYLARDYAGLRTRLLDRLATLLDGWSDASPADPLVTLAELFAYAGDRLTLWQDAVAGEAYLTTARRRPSVRRHARLLDYRMHDGCAARTWLAFEVDAEVELPRRMPVAPGRRGAQRSSRRSRPARRCSKPGPRPGCCPSATCSRCTPGATSTHACPRARPAPMCATRRARTPSWRPATCS